MSLLSRLVLIISIALLPALAFQAYSETQARHIRQKLAEDEALRIVGLASFLQQRVADAADQVLTVIGSAPSVRDSLPGHCAHLLANVVHELPRYNTATVIGLDGHPLCMSQPFDPDLDLSDRVYFRRALQTDDFFVGDYGIGQTTRRPSIHMARPFRDRAGQVAGVAVVALDVAWLGQQLARLKLPPEAAISITDRNGTILARVPDGPQFVGGSIQAEDRFILDGREIGIAPTTSKGGRKRVAAYAPVGVDPNGMGVWVALDQEITFAPVTQANQLGLLLILAGAALALAVTALAGTHLIRRPVRRLLQVADRWRTGDLAARTGLPAGGSEFGRLAAAFDAMAASLQTREHALRTVVESTTDSVIMLDRDWRITFISDRAKAHVAPGRDVLGQIVWDAFPGTGNGFFAAAFRKAMETGEPTHAIGHSAAFDTQIEAHAYPSGDGLTIYFRDATEASRLAAALRQSEELFRAAFEKAAIGMALVGPDGSWLRVNDGLCAITGCTRDELLASRFQDITHPDDLQADLARMRALLAGEIPIQCTEKRYLRKDGGIGWVNITASLLRDGDGAPERIVAVIEDISARRNAEAALRESELLFRATFEQAAVGMSQVALDGRWLRVNDKMCAILGYAREELCASRWQDLTHPDDIAADTEQVRALQAGEIAIQRIDKRYLRKDGTHVWVSLTSAVLHDLEGRPERFVTVIEDITERRRIAAALNESEQLFRATFEQTSVGMALIGLDGARLHVNGVLCAMTGYTRDELLAGRVADINHPDEREADRSAMQALLEGHDPGPLERRYLRKDGHLGWATVCPSLLRDSAGRPKQIFAVTVDITERKRFEAALQESETRLQLAREAAGISIMDYDRIAGVMIWSAEHWRLHGLEPRPGSPTYESWRATVHPDDIGRVEAAWESALAGSAGSFDSEYRVVWPDGTVHWLLAKAKLIRGPRGETVRVVGLAMDVTASRQAEAALRESESRLRLAQQAAGIGTWDYDFVSRQMAWSPEQYRIHGLDSAAGPPSFQAWLDMLDPEDRPAIRDAEIAMQAPGAESLRQEFRIRRRSDGALRWISSLSRVIRDDAGHTIRLVGVNSDITERRQAEEDLRQATALLSAIGNCSPDLIFAKDIEGRLLFANPATLAVIGRPAEEVIGRTDAEWHHNPAQAAVLMANDRRVVETGRAEVMEEIFDTAALGTRIFRSAKAPLRMADGSTRGIAGMASDITQIRQDEAELRRLTANLEERVREEIAAREEALTRAAQAERAQALGLLAGGIAHDFNNVLQAVATATALIERRPDDQASVVRFARLASEATRRGAAVTGRLLAFGRRAHLRPAPLDAACLLPDLRELLEHTIGAAIDVRIELAADLPRLIADRGQLETVLVNLASNARDAMPGGGRLTIAAASETVPPAGQSHAAGLNPGRYLRITVADTGVGMDAATLARAGEPFFTTKGNAGGTGLDLSIAKGFAEQSGGALVIASFLGAGTTVTIWLPEAGAGAASAQEGPDRAGSEAALSTGPAVVMVVDDEDLVRETLAGYLEDEGFHVLLAGNGNEALALLACREPVDILVTDLSMPGMDGLALIRAVQERRPGFPALLLTGYAREEVLRAADEAVNGDLTLLRKPVSGRELIERLRALLLERTDAAE